MQKPCDPIATPTAFRRDGSGAAVLTDVIALFSDVDPEARVRPDHPRRMIRQLTDVAPASLGQDSSELHAARMGRPPIPPEMLGSLA